MFINSAFAQAGTAVSTGGSMGLILQLVLIFLVFYILLIRPQQKKIKQHEAMVSALKKGDMIITGGGIYAKVVDISDPVDLTVEIASNVSVKVNRGTIRDVIVPEAKAPAANANKKSK